MQINTNTIVHRQRREQRLRENESVQVQPERPKKISAHEKAAKKLEDLLLKRVSDEYSPIGDDITPPQLQPTKRSNRGRHSRHSGEVTPSNETNMRVSPKHRVTNLYPKNQDSNSHQPSQQKIRYVPELRSTPSSSILSRRADQEHNSRHLSHDDDSVEPARTKKRQSRPSAEYINSASQNIIMQF